MRHSLPGLATTIRLRQWEVREGSKDFIRPLTELIALLDWYLISSFLSNIFYAFLPQG